VTLPDHNVETYIPPEDVYGILAAPPCTMFSMARTTAKTPRDLRQGMATVEACLRIIWQCQYGGKRLQFWTLENPVARLQWFLGKPTMIFDPSDYGDRHIKPTALWGNSNVNLKKSPAQLTEEEVARAKTNSRRLPKLPDGYLLPPDMNITAAKRSMTPQGFAKAFMEANK